MVYVQPYKSNNRNTGVIAYEIADNSISLRFRDGSIYLYTVKSTGKKHISQMKALAKEGAGLTTYVNQHVRDEYEAKLR